MPVTTSASDALAGATEHVRFGATMPEPAIAAVVSAALLATWLFVSGARMLRKARTKREIRSCALCVQACTSACVQADAEIRSHDDLA